MIHSKKLLQATNVTLTVVTNPASATCDLTYNGQTYSNTKTATVLKGTVVSYSLYDSSHPSATGGTGSITMNSNKTLNATCTYSTSTSFNTTNYTKKGSLTIDSSYYASNFTTSNYICSKSNASSFMSTSSWEVYVRFKCSNVSPSKSTEQFVMGNKRNTSTGYTHGAGIWVENSQVKCRASKTTKSLLAYNGSISNNSWTTVKINYNGTTYNCYVNGTNVKSVTDGEINWYNTPICLGVCPYNTSSVHHEGTYITIDLASTYVKSGNTYYYLVNTAYNYYWDIS